MRINNLFNTPYPKQTRSTSQQVNTFANTLNQANATAKSAQTDTYSMPTKIMMPKENTLFFNKTGNYSYAENSTEENPIILVEGYDAQGNRFETKVKVNEVNPYNATEIEMTALGVHTGKIKGLESMFGAMPLHRKPMGMNERANFIELFAKNITDQKTIGQHQNADKLRSNMEFYMEFWKGKNKFPGNY